MPSGQVRERETPPPLTPIKRAVAAPSPLDQDVWIYRIGVVSVSLLAMGGLIGAIVLAFVDKDIPQAVVAIASAAVGGLAGLLTRRR